MHHYKNDCRGKVAVVVTLFLIILSGILPGCIRDNEPRATIESTLHNEIAQIDMYLFSDPSLAVIKGERTIAAASDSATLYGAKSSMVLACLLAGNADSSRLLRCQTDGFIARNPGLHELGEIHNYHLAILYNINGDLDSSIVFAGKAVTEAIEARLPERQILNLSIIGEAHEMLGRPVEATSVYRRAVAVSDSAFPGKSVSQRILIGLAATYSSIGNYEMADKYFALTEKAIMDGDAFGPCFIYYSTLGTSLYNREDYRRAIDIFHKALVYADSLRNMNFIGIAQANLAECHMLTGNLDSADYYLDRAQVNLSVQGDMDVNQQFYFNSLRGDLTLRQGYVEKAYGWLQKASRDTSRVLPRYAAFHYGRLARYYTYTANYIDAIEYQARARQITDSIRNRSAFNYTAELELRYAQDTTVLASRMNLAQKVREVNHLRIVIVSIILLVLIIMLGIAVRIVVLNRRHTSEAMRLSSDMQRLRMENISNRISSHFIFNLLNGVNLTDECHIREVKELIRQNLELAGKSLVTLREELGYIEQYITVESDTLGEDFTTSTVIAEGIDLDRPIPAMMLEIFVENSIKHGLRGFAGPKFLNISVTHRPHGIQIEIQNNGRMTSTAPGTGTGMRIIFQTVHLLNIHNRHKITIHHGIEDNQTTYRVTIFIPDSYSFAAMFH